MVTHPDLVKASGDIPLQTNVLLVAIKGVLPHVQGLQRKLECLVIFLHLVETERFVPDVSSDVHRLLESQRPLDSQGTVVVCDGLTVIPVKGKRQNVSSFAFVSEATIKSFAVTATRKKLPLTGANNLQRFQK